MGKGRLEAFSDGVIAIIITIMVLELKVPHGSDWAALRPLAPTLASYVLSFVYVGIYWNNHHHMLHATRQVDGAVLWANLHLLFWLSLIPFVTAWMGENAFSGATVAAYGAVMLLCAVAYSILARLLIRAQGHDSLLARALGADVKGLVSLVVYLVAMAATWIDSRLSLACYVVVALMWLVPDRRIARAMPQGE
jgi:uncharacterized membrane protein